MKKEFIILDGKGVIVVDSKTVQEILGSKQTMHDLNITKVKHGYLITWEQIEERYKYLIEKANDIKKRLELIVLIRIKKENLEQCD